MKRALCTMLLACLGLLAAPLSAYAEGNVIYEKDAGEFIFEPGSDYSPTDLFTHFKDVMPGDSITQKVTVRNDASKKVKIKVYMRSLGAHEDSVDFLSQLNLRIAKDEESEMAYMFDAPADQTAQLTDWVYLGTLYSGGEIDLDVTLDVPVTLDNEFKNLVGYLDWQFMIEELPVEPDDPKPPDTGDESELLLWGGVFAGSLLMILFIVFLAKRKKDEEEEKNGMLI